MADKKKWTRSEIETLLSTNPRAVERGLVAIWNRQTQDEKSASDVKHHNGIGFAASTARRGSYLAKWVSSGRTLTGKHLENGRKITMLHAGQLTCIANGE